ncbi:zinc/iron transporter protein [Apiospora rasikravindrae]|uniref:Zinc/iron transporter protein n=1 Tax=Apiospora rasikravindrae TaxID=990691 RepID=A0ABR1SXL1_9PEZI
MVSSTRNSGVWTQALLVSLLLLGEVSAHHMGPNARRQQQATTTAPPSSTTTASPKVTAISDCHNHGATVFCMFGTSEYQILGQATATTPPPPVYTDCHSHGSDMFCVGPDGSDVEVAPEGSALESGGKPEGDHDHDHDHGHGEGDASSEGGVNCHFHAGVEHCVGAGQSEASAATASCGRRDRDYDVPLRIGLLFAILVAGCLGAAFPILITPVLPKKYSGIMVVFKQFGTGVIISTAFVHLFTHAFLMFGNECLKDTIKFEGTTAAIVMAGLVLSFFVDYGCHRLAKSRQTPNETEASASSSNNFINVMILEAGIIFHSILIGLTLVVAGDPFFTTLFVVILFHQMFEGLALGTRIAATQQHEPSSVTNVSPLLSVEPPPAEAKTTAAGGSDEGGNHGSSSAPSTSPSPRRVSSWTWKELLMVAAFGITTPIGMGIGIGVLQHFNGQDPRTLIAMGTLDALSAGILLWVGIVEMWAHDWMIKGGEFVNAGAATTAYGSVGLIAGMALMSFLGLWA